MSESKARLKRPRRCGWCRLPIPPGELATIIHSDPPSGPRHTHYFHAICYRAASRPLRK